MYMIGVTDASGNVAGPFPKGPQQFEVELRDKLERSNLTGTDMSRVVSWNVWELDRYQLVNPLAAPPPASAAGGDKKTFDGVVTLSSLVG
jgi:hypothetical protein